MAQTSPPKPWQIRQTQGSASNSTLRVSSAVANGRSIPDTTGNTDLNTPGTASSSLAPPIPSRPGANSTLSRYGGVDSYNRYGSYGSGYGGYGGYGSYGSYGSMNSGYGGYGSRYGSYGSSYGGYGSSYGGYGSSYGGYGSYGRFGGMNGPMMGQNNNQSYFQGAFNQISKFGQIAESFSMFSRLLDANFDAMHGSFASVARLLEVFGEFLYVVQTFAVFRYTGRLVNWMLGKNTTSLKRIGGSGKEAAVISMDDFKRFENRGKSKFFPLVFVLLGFTVIGIPMFLSRIWKRMKGENLDSIWNEEPDVNQPQISRALFDFNGSAPEELSFRQNDIIKILGKPFPDWWEGEINGRRGLFPCNYVEAMENPEQQPVDPNKKPVS